MVTRGADGTSPTRRAVRIAVVPLALALLAAGSAGCALGERPSFVDAGVDTSEGSMTGDPAIDAVLVRLDAVGTAIFTAHYTATLTFGGTSTELDVVQNGTATHRSVEIGDVRYLTDGADLTTCVTATQVCTRGIDAAAVSDTGVTPDFAFGALAKRLRRDAVAKIGAATASTMQVDGLTGTCVDVPVSGGSKVYCVLDNGVIARFVGGDVSIEMLTYTSTVDPTLFKNP